MFNKHNTVHPAPKQVAWLNLAVGAGPQIREFTNPRERIAKACTWIMNLWVRIQKRGYGLLIRGHDLLNRGNSLRICEYGL